MLNDFRPNASVATLRERARILSRVRSFFDRRDFFEVQTPLLSRDTVIDRYIDPLSVTIQTAGESGQPFFLQTSPEFAMKRLLAAGAKAIYQICPAIRADESGRLHNIEFTMLEWYRVGDRYEQGMDLLDEFAQEFLDCPPATRLSYCEAVKLFFNGFDLRSGTADEKLNELRALLNQDEPLEHLFAGYIEPGLQTFDSVILYDWPADQAALAKIRTDSTEGFNQFAERFELYANGIELANGYHELTDADELMTRNVQNNQIRSKTNRELLPESSRLIQAMQQGLPDCCGVALGVDRLVMLMLDKSNIQDVMAFDSTRA